MMPLIRAEWLKLSRRPLGWILLSISFLLLTLQLLAQTFITLGSGMGLFNTASDLPIETYRQMAVFPGIFGAVFAHINGIGGIFAVILAAAAMGNEYSWGTLRTQLARQPERGRYLLAKLATIMLLLLVAIVIHLVYGSVLGWALGGVLGGAGAPSGAALLLLPLAIGRALFVLLPYVLLTLFCAIGGRSLLVGLAGGLGYLLLEGGVNALAILASIGGIFEAIMRLTIGQNITALSRLNLLDFGISVTDYGGLLDPDRLPSPLIATITLLVYLAALGWGAFALLKRRDVPGAG